jgi:ferredoxin
MKIVVDLNRCQTYGQCVFAAPTVFRLHGEEALEYDYEPDDALRLPVERAAAACPVQAISIERTDEPPVGVTRAAVQEVRRA